MATAALRGQEQISQQLQRSYSLNDVSNRRPGRQRVREFERQEDWIEEVPEERHLGDGDHSHSWAGDVIDVNYFTYNIKHLSLFSRIRQLKIPPTTVAEVPRNPLKVMKKCLVEVHELDEPFSKSLIFYFL